MNLMSAEEIHVIEAVVHGRYLVHPVSDGTRVVLGFHGYGESADAHLAELGRVEPEGWTLVAIQALHPFYNRRTQEVVASWMTRQDREQAITDNVAYVRNVVAELRGRLPIERLAISGFSQGAAMAYRAAIDPAIGASGIAVLGGDLPPDVEPSISVLPPVLIGRGSHDEWYTEEKLNKDLKLLEGSNSQVCRFDGGHEWSAEFRTALRDFLGTLATKR
jgi:predicted esterase